MVKLLVIADDFTGALDTSVQFAKQGISSVVNVLDNDNVSRLISRGDCEVLAVDIESRHLSPAGAYERVSSLVRRAIELGVEFIYKKTDSALRGNIGSELAGMLDNIPPNELIFVPAFPKAGRVTIKGCHYVNNVPVNDSEFAKDPFNPVHYADVSSIILDQSNIATRCVHFDEFAKLLDGRAAEKTIYVVDARSDEDLELIGTVLSRSNKANFLAGCAGMAALLPSLLNFKRGSLSQDVVAGNTLVVSGSISPLVSRQVRYGQRKCRYSVMTLSPEQLIMPEKTNIPDFVKRVELALAENGKLILEAPQNKEQLRRNEEYAFLCGIAPEGIAMRIASNMGLLTREIIISQQVDRLVIFGGDTLRGVMDKLNVLGVQPLQEIAPGVVFSKLIGGISPMSVITKAGGLGGDNVLEEIDKFLN
ncbi:MAG: hypothetical protein LBS53_00290 [Synergistaceae bacterium]|jgi:uncharacterized protein YgbK (DUF1537 family)|nr:hypothetical protein [Synergistaceae bacterium]